MKKIFLAMLFLGIISTGEAQTTFKTGLVNSKIYKYNVKISTGVRGGQYVSISNINNNPNGKLKATLAEVNTTSAVDASGIKIDQDQVANAIKGAIGNSLFQTLSNDKKNYLGISFKFGQDKSINEVAFYFPSYMPLTPQMIEDIEVALKVNVHAKFDERIIKVYGVPAYKTLEWIPYNYSFYFRDYQIK